MDFEYQRDRIRRPDNRPRPQPQRQERPAPKQRPQERPAFGQQPRLAHGHTPRPDHRFAGRAATSAPNRSSLELSGRIPSSASSRPVSGVSSRPAAAASSRPTPRATQRPTSDARSHRQLQTPPGRGGEQRYGRRPAPSQRQARPAYGTRRRQFPSLGAQQTYGRARSSQRSIYGNRGRGSKALNPRLIAVLAALLLVCVGVFSAVNAAQRNAVEQAALEQAAAEKKALEQQRVKPTKLGQELNAFSTPRSAWKQGEMPHLYQTDPAWAELPYGGGTVRANACGPTCMSMVYTCLTGRTDMDPGAMAAWADANNYAPTGATEWAFMSEGASLLGVYGEAFWPARATITEHLNAGRPVIASVKPGDFTTLGHFIVLKSIDGRGMVEVFDPNSPLNSTRRWGIQELLLQIDNTWFYSV